MGAPGRSSFRAAGLAAFCEAGIGWGAGIRNLRAPTSGERSAIAKAVAIAVVEAGANASGIIDKIKEASWLYQA